MNASAIITGAVFVLVLDGFAHSSAGVTSCRVVQSLAQEHAQDMARRERLDHAGFAKRAARGARAENVAMGYSSKLKTLAQWQASPRHAANMRLPGCKGLAHAVSRNGTYYWVLIIGR
ncbi:MAG: CAP domain-containing protein [Pseudorhodoplanes sp.]|nr:CAP domain-containing protein [Pseudorhodoplanes sp.]